MASFLFGRIKVLFTARLFGSASSSVQKAVYVRGYQEPLIGFSKAARRHLV